MKYNLFRYVIASMAAVLALISCETLNDGQPDGDDSGVCRLTIGLDQTWTKASNTTWIENEKRFKNVYFYIFDADTKNFETRIGGTTNIGYTASLRYGTKVIIALVNVHDKTLEALNSATIKTISDLQGHYAHYPRGSEMEYLPAYGSTTHNLSTPSVTMSFKAYNMMSRFMLKSVTNNLQGSLAGKTITLKNVFLSNLLGVCPIRDTYTEDDLGAMLWFHKAGRKYQATSADDIIRTANDGRAGTRAMQILNVDVSHGGSYNLTSLYGLYAFMNPYTTDVQGWSNTGSFPSRFTRMVITAEIDGVTYYYPINLRNFKPGYSYDVNLTITQLGSDDPDTFNFQGIPPDPTVPDDDEDVTIDVGDIGGGGGSIDIEF